MRVLILNRRDIANPAGGGAETYTHEIAKGLVNEYECEVTVFASGFAGAAAEEMIDGVRYIRRGNEVTVHLWGFYYALKNRKGFDKIIDEFNGIGFMTFFFPNSMLLIHQLYKEFWLRELGIFGIIPYILEPIFLRCYKGKSAITVSNSSKNDLTGMGFCNISVVMNAVRNTPRDIACEKFDDPTLIFLGRLRSTKRPEDAIGIFRIVKERIPNAKLLLVGRGPDERKLKIMAKGLDDIMFCGWVDEEEKILLLGRSHILLVPSVREGFGINVIEAASVGTPSIGYEVPGLRDSIRHGKTGFLANSLEEAASMVIELLTDKQHYERMSSNCMTYSREFVWSRRVLEFWNIIHG